MLVLLCRADPLEKGNGNPLQYSRRSKCLLAIRISSFEKDLSTLLPIFDVCLTTDM